ncbi:type II toxin-antitoxin system prevent-host-death family antitoxin [Saccharothrix sp. S26]|uniref:type II toxin-antitoxin system Phd/YefM family antitoxin n=1 Tax=Saccharothrix sp. S26 TaxID=2907215 RepID=UPI001F40C56A|nr:type II toxin-antitoxin system prevent-host-death family antitoxin [Saccharothrix sp. S26]MCE6999789.1 type II toxin-antitoxin system prevent-host-death family antitoxin [Saccharothrix sp. S26]
MESIGLRDLRHHTSEYVRRAEAGERIAVTDHGRVVAEIGPPQNGTSSLRDELIANGELLRGRGGRLPEPLPATSGTPISEVLRQMREAERW